LLIILDFVCCKATSPYFGFEFVLYLVFAGGILMQKMASCLKVLAEFLRQSCPVVASMVVADKSAGTGRRGSVVSYVASVIGM
jgi:hypothetical protein